MVSREISTICGRRIFFRALPKLKVAKITVIDLELLGLQVYKEYAKNVYSTEIFNDQTSRIVWFFDEISKVSQYRQNVFIIVHESGGNNSTQNRIRDLQSNRFLNEINRLSIIVNVCPVT